MRNGAVDAASVDPLAVSLIEQLRKAAPRGKERAWASFPEGLAVLFGES